jgi:hypothetical protein
LFGKLSIEIPRSPTTLVASEQDGNIAEGPEKLTHHRWLVGVTGLNMYITDLLFTVALNFGVGYYDMISNSNVRLQHKLA